MRMERTGLIVLCVMAFSAVPLMSCGTTPPLTPQGTTPTPAPPPPPPPQPSTEWFGDGNYLVGVDVSPGRWHTDGPRTERGHGAVETSKCTWTLGWFDIKFGVPVMLPIARNDDSGPADVDLGPDGVTFQTQGCKAWQRR